MTDIAAASKLPNTPQAWHNGGFVTNLGGARHRACAQPAPLRGDACRFAPRSERTTPTVSVFGSTGQVPPGVEGVVRCHVKREEPLRGSRRSESLHLALSAPNADMCPFDPIILPTTLVMPGRQPKIPEAAA